MNGRDRYISDQPENPENYPRIVTAETTRRQIKELYGERWIERVKKNLFPVSEEKAKIIKALREWIYSGVMIDLDENAEGEEGEKTRADCELCDHPKIRYQFEIENQHNRNTLLIGSECITKFDDGIGVIDEKGQRLTGEAAKKKVENDRNKLIEAAKLRGVIKALEALALKDKKFNADNFINYYKSRGAFTPNQVAIIIGLLRKNRIQFNPSHFKMVMRRDREKGQLQSMPDWRLRQIWHCLSKSQRDWVLEMRKKQGRKSEKESRTG